MDTTTVNLVLDVVLIAASIWMIYAVRGIGGIMGKTLNWIVAGTIILGVAHLQATITADLGWFKDSEGVSWNGSVHRFVVLIGFFVLIYGFQQLKAIRD